MVELLLGRGGTIQYRRYDIHAVGQYDSCPAEVQLHAGGLDVEGQVGKGAFRPKNETVLRQLAGTLYI